MKYRKLLTSAILVSAICLITVLVLTTEKAEAWNWSGFSSLCVDGTLRGPAGDTVTFTLENVTVYTQCYNIQSGNYGQPGVGNAGNLEISVYTIPSPEKKKGIVSVDGCIDLCIFDDHHGSQACLGDHIHTCHPLDNVNKEEQLGSAWIADFVATWVWKDENGKIINSGTDTCHTWNGYIGEDGIPVEGDFTCDSTSAKKIKWITE